MQEPGPRSKTHIPNDGGVSVSPPPVIALPTGTEVGISGPVCGPVSYFRPAVSYFPSLLAEHSRGTAGASERATKRMSVPSMAQIRKNGLCSTFLEGAGNWVNSFPTIRLESHFVCLNPPTGVKFYATEAWASLYRGYQKFGTSSNLPFGSRSKMVSAR